METNFQIKVQTEDIDKELREYLYTKLRHIATEEANKLVDEKFNELVSGKISDYFKDMYAKNLWSFRSQFDSAVQAQIEKHAPNSVKIFNEMNKIIEERVSEYDIESLVRRVLEEEIEKVALDTIKEKVVNALK